MTDPSTLETAYDALSAEHRRHLLIALMNAEDWLNVPQDVPELHDVTRSLEVRLHHLDLPKLEASGLIDWDRRTNQIAPGTRFEEIRAILASME